MFQSRSGFLVRRDLEGRLLVVEVVLTPGFNPVVGFWSVATKAGEVQDEFDYAFQSRSGFLVRRDIPVFFKQSSARVSIP